MAPANTKRVRFGAFEFDPRSGELHGPNGTNPLSKQVADLLQILVEQAPDLATRDEIRQKLWPETNFIEFEVAIRAAIKKLRDALSDPAGKQDYIQTLKRRGYRLQVPVEWLDAPPDNTPLRPAFQVDRLSGLIITHYRVGEIIGRGGMGIVYRAEDMNLGRTVAIKFLPEELAEDAKARERFRREAFAISQLEHPNICPVYSLDEWEGHPFIVMQFLEGKSLREHIAAGRLRLAELGGLGFEVAVQIARGLEVAHEKGIIHRDIKPANIFITHKNEVKILDFGVALVLATVEAEERDSIVDPLGRQKLRDTFLYVTNTAGTLGTLGYMSPEQLQGDPLDIRTDIFSFGLVLYEMATGARAFAGDPKTVANAILNLEPHPLKLLAPEISPTLEEIIGKCLQKRREDRFATASELLTALENARGEVQPPRKAAVESERVLEAATPSESTVGKPIEVVVMVRCVQSEGLREYLQVEILPKLTSGDVRERPFRFQFETGEGGMQLPTKVVLRLASPGCSPASQTKKLILPANGDSEPCIFQVTPLSEGDLVLLLELLNRQGQMIATRPLRTRVVHESPVERPALTFVAIPLQLISGWTTLATEKSGPMPDASAGMAAEHTAFAVEDTKSGAPTTDDLLNNILTGAVPVMEKPDRALVGPPDSATEIFSSGPGRETILGGRYRLIRVIGEGGMGAVYLAEDLQSGKRISIGLDSRDGPFRGLATSEQQSRPAKLTTVGRSQELTSEPRTLQAHAVPPESALMQPAIVKSSRVPRWIVVLTVLIIVGAVPYFWLHRELRKFGPASTPITIVVAQFATPAEGDHEIAGQLPDAQKIVTEQLAHIPKSQVKALDLKGSSQDELRLNVPWTPQKVIQACRLSSARILVTGGILAEGRDNRGRVAYRVSATAWNCSNTQDVAMTVADASNSNELAQALQSVAQQMQQKLLHLTAPTQPSQ